MQVTVFKEFKGKFCFLELLRTSTFLKEFKDKWEACDNNTQDNFVVLSSWQKHCEDSTSSNKF